MAWTVVIDPDIDNARDGDTIGSYVATFIDAELFPADRPFSIAERWNFKESFDSLATKINDQLAVETNRRQVAAKIKTAMELALNGA